MDQFCINLKVLFDNNDIATLEGPGEHSVHCLIDVPQCINSGYEVLIDPAEGQTTHCRGFLLDKAGNDKLVEYAKEVGKCTNCDQTVSETDKEGITQGLRATVTGTITSVGDANTPASIVVSDISDISSSSLCASGTTKLPLSAETCGAGVDMTVDPTPTGGVRSAFLDTEKKMITFMVLVSGLLLCSCF